MKICQFFLLVFFLIFIFEVRGQSAKKHADYRKFFVSLNAGFDFPIGTSNTVTEHFTLPFAKKGFVPGFDGAYFFSKNYGVGIKYRFYTSDYDEDTYSEYTEQVFEYPVHQLETIQFDETTHLLGPALYARWGLGESKWMITADAGPVYLRNKLSNTRVKYRYNMALPDDHIIIQPEDFPVGTDYGLTLTGQTVGLALSAGIGYQITPLIGIGVKGNGVFASLSKYDISRKINRIGLSAGIDFSF